jgi:hypothetical protein
MDRALAHTIAAAVGCGISWRDAAQMGSRLEVRRKGVFVCAVSASNAEKLILDAVYTNPPTVGQLRDALDGIAARRAMPKP